MLNCGDHAGLLREEEEEGLSAFSPKTCACLVATPWFTNASLWLAFSVSCSLSSRRLRPRRLAVKGYPQEWLVR